MTTEADIGYGTLFQTADSNSPGAWTIMAEVTNITPPNRSRDSIDASHEQSPDEYREFIPGMKDGGEVTLEMNFIPGGTSLAAISAEYDLVGQAAVKLRRITFRDGSYCQFYAFITGDEPEAPLDDKMAMTATFKVTGKPTYTQAP